MNEQTTQKVNDLIMTLCDHMEEMIIHDVLEDNNQLPKLVKSLADLIESQRPVILTQMIEEEQQHTALGPGKEIKFTSKVEIVRRKETLQDELMSAIYNSGLSYSDAFSVIQRVEAVFMNKGRNFLKGVNSREVADQPSLPM